MGRGVSLCWCRVPLRERPKVVLFRTRGGQDASIRWENLLILALSII